MLLEKNIGFKITILNTITFIKNEAYAKFVICINSDADPVMSTLPLLGSYNNACQGEDKKK